MSPIPQPVSSQYRPPQPDQILRSGRTTLQGRGRGQHQQKGSGLVQPPSINEITVQPSATVSKAPKDPENRPPPSEKAPACGSTLWPGAGRMSGNLFEDRNWLLPPNYLNNNGKKATSPKSTIKEEPKTGEQEKCGWGPDCPLCKD